MFYHKHQICQNRFLIKGFELYNVSSMVYESQICLVDRKPLNRRFIVVEGIYQYLGDIAQLDKIYELKEKYKYRLMVDESIAFGVLGENGRGACEHFGLGSGSVEIIVASMSNSLASIGGFCVGDWEIVDHQRLSGLGYCYSASLPPYLATAASAALSKLAIDSGIRRKCQSNSKFLRKNLKAIPGRILKVLLIDCILHVKFCYHQYCCDLLTLYRVWI